MKLGHWRKGQVQAVFHSLCDCEIFAKLLLKLYSLPSPSHDCLTVDHRCGEVRGRGGPAEGVVGAAGGGHARGQLGPGGGEAKQSS